MREKPRLIILAAGQGTRLRPLTDKHPKCLVEVCGKPVLQWQVEIAHMAGIQDIVIVRGYRAETITIPGVVYVENSRYEKTNMVETLFCAEKFFSDPLFVSYGDILYEKRVIDTLLGTNYPIAVVVDTNWKPYWEERFDDPLRDAETLKISKQGRIIEIGQRPRNINEVQAQYIGLTAYRGEGIDALRYIYSREKDDSQKGYQTLAADRGLSQLYMTDVLQGLIKQGYDVFPVSVSGGWLEIDSLRDLTLARQYAVVDGSGLLEIRRYPMV